MEQRNKTLGEFIIENQNAFQYSSGELSRIINSIRLAAKVVNYKVNKAGLVDIVGAAGEQNIQGEDQQKLDVYANEVFIQTLIVRLYVVLPLRKTMILLRLKERIKAIIINM